MPDKGGRSKAGEAPQGIDEYIEGLARPAGNKKLMHFIKRCSRNAEEKGPEAGLAP